MHGIVHAELKNFVESTKGADAWKAVLQEAGLGHQMYLPVTSYPDQEIMRIVSAASKLTDTPADQLLEAFGEFIGPTLLKMYGHLVKPEWKTEELLLNVEDTIHSVVRVKNPGAQPPKLRFEKTGTNTLTLFYKSPRQMQALAIGIMKAVAKHYHQTISYKQRPGAGGGTEIDLTVN